jgi:hypothetical protein
MAAMDPCWSHGDLRISTIKTGQGRWETYVFMELSSTYYTDEYGLGLVNVATAINGIKYWSINTLASDPSLEKHIRTASPSGAQNSIIHKAGPVEPREWRTIFLRLEASQGLLHKFCTNGALEVLNIISALDTPDIISAQSGVSRVMCVCNWMTGLIRLKLHM